jgi:hypothetical protein
MKKIYQKKIAIASVIIAIGIVLTTVYSEKSGSIGITLIAIGGLFFISVMKKAHRSGSHKDKGQEEE